jgi:CRISPR/Cas system CSM-associated protein Csm3 (group 7 of RAMP superfamily)
VIVDHGQRALDATRWLLRALAGFNLDPVQGPIQLGSGTNHGWGRMACLFSTVRVQEWTPTAADRPDVPQEKLKVADELREGLAHPPGPLKARVQIRLRLEFGSPFLVNDPAKACAIQAARERIVRSGADDQAKQPDHVPRVARVRIEKSPGAGAGQATLRDKLLVRPLLPATAFRGPVRAQLERILRTIHPKLPVAPHGELDPVTGLSPAFVQHLFGFDKRESGLWCSEFVGPPKEKDDVRPVQREMVAIDRFTGGASEHAKFDALCLDRPQLEGVLALDLPADQEDARRTLGAAILLLRDLIEGDVAFGWGDMKGFGQCRARILHLAAAGLDQTPRLVPQIEQQTGKCELNEWMNQVRESLAAGREAPRIGQANSLLDEFLDAVRKAVPLEE